MIRYLSSFILTTFLYSICIGVFLYAFSNEKLTQVKKVPPKIISLNHIVLVKKEEPKAFKEEKIIPKVAQPLKEEHKVVEKKIIPKKKKKIVKKQPKKIEKVVKKKSIKKKEIVKKVVKQEPVVPIKEVIITKQKVVHLAPIVDYKEDFFLKKNLLLIKKRDSKTSRIFKKS